MNIILSQPIVEDAKWNQGSFPPLGLLYLAASLKSIPNTQVQVIDGFGEGLSIEKTAEDILAASPDVVGMSITSRNFIEGLEVLRLVKHSKPQVVTICGGIHASLFDDLILQEAPYVDFVLRGEAEESLPALVKALSTGTSVDSVAGLSRRVADTIIRGVPQIVSDLDSLAHPDRSMLKPNIYGTQWYGFQLPSFPKITTAFTSRGCPHSCLFCSNSVMNRKYRIRSPENILEELIEIEKSGYEYVVFFDDNLTANIKRTDKLCKLIIQAQLKLKFLSTGMPYLLPDETLSLMHKAGFFLMFVGAESGSDSLLKQYRKPSSAAKLIEGIQRAQKANILIIASFICGHKKETPDDHEASKKLIKQAQPFFSEINPLMVHPGSSLWDEIHLNNKPKKLKDTHSRLISRFPNQLDKQTIEFRLKDFRKTQHNLLKNWKMYFLILRILRKNRLGYKILKALMVRPAVIFQILKGNKPR